MGGVDWGTRLSWGSPVARTTSRFFSDKVVKKFGRRFYDSFLFDGKRVELHDCVGVALTDDDHRARRRRLGHPRPSARSLARAQGAETSRVLELWEDTKGPEKGHKYFLGRWLFYPHHLNTADETPHPEQTRKRTGLDARQVYEQCDAAANDDVNPLASVRAVQRVLCCWKDRRNRVPSKEELLGAHAWFDSAWDDNLREVVPLDECVDKPNDGALHVVAPCSHASDAP